MEIKEVELKFRNGMVERTTTELIVEKGTTNITSKATINGNTKTSPATDKEFYVLVPREQAENIDGVIKVTVKGK